jgi:hypothetical protein
MRILNLIIVAMTKWHFSFLVEFYYYRSRASYRTYHSPTFHSSATLRNKAKTD